MGIKLAKLEGPITPFEFGCCSPVRLGVWVNPEVTAQVYSANGYPLRLTPEAVQKIQTAYKGTPLRVLIEVPCCSCRCAPRAKCCDCSFPTPVYANFAEYTELWFANKNSESMCQGGTAYVLNKCCGGIPQACSLHFIDTVTISPDQVRLNTDQDLFTFCIVSHPLHPPAMQKMTVDFYHLPKSNNPTQQ